MASLTPLNLPGDDQFAEEIIHQAKQDGDELLVPPRDLDFCPRCGTRVEVILWGHTNCPCCGLHFECC